MVLKILSSSPSSSSTKKNIIISSPTNFKKRTFRESINIKDCINKEWFKIFKESKVKKSQLENPEELLHIYTTIYNYMGLNNNSNNNNNNNFEPNILTIFKNKPPNNQCENYDEKVCTICIDEIKDKDSVWCCNNCLNFLHTDCVQQWADRTPSVYQWNCPNCRGGHDDLPYQNCTIFNK